jgi:hypothetical protein
MPSFFPLTAAMFDVLSSVVWYDKELSMLVWLGSPPDLASSVLLPQN